VTNECWKSRGKLQVDKERLTIFVMMGTRMDSQSFSKEVGIGSSLHSLLGRDCNRNISVSDVSWKVLSDTGGEDVVEWRLKDIIQSFLGLCSYYKMFICNLLVLTALPFAFMKKGEAFV